MISECSQNLPRHGRTWEKPFHKQKLVTVVNINHGTLTQQCLFLKASPRLSIQQTCQIPREVSFAALGSQGKHSCLKCFMVTDDTSVLLWEITWCRQELRVEEIKSRGVCWLRHRGNMKRITLSSGNHMKRAGRRDGPVPWGPQFPRNLCIYDTLFPPQSPEKPARPGTETSLPVATIRKPEGTGSLITEES